MFINLPPIIVQQPCCIHEHRQIEANILAKKEQSLKVPKKNLHNSIGEMKLR